MITHGGVRSGAGRPKGGVTDARRRIVAAINQGLAQAGRKLQPDRVSQDDDEQAAIQTGAMIVDDMIQAGQGNDVLKLWAAVAMKEPEGERSSQKNTLAEALSRLPAAGHVADVSRIATNQPEAPEIEGGATHTEREAPHNSTWFAPQAPLLLNDPVAEQSDPLCDDDRAQAS
jgi:hypothetical protein